MISTRRNAQLRQLHRDIARAMGAIVALALFILANPCDAQSIWEVTPYRVRVWVSVDPSAALPTSWSDSLAKQLTVTAESKIHAVWRLSVASPPAQLRAQLARTEDLTWERLTSVAPELSEIDKLMLVRVGRNLDGYQVTVHEFDLSTHVLSAPVTRDRICLTRQIAPATLDLMCEVFSPIISIERIEQGEDDKTKITAVTRAGSLVRPENSLRYWKMPTIVSLGQVLQPVIRKSDRSGRVTAKGVKTVEWTLLTVVPPEATESESGTETAEVQTKGTVSCSLRSGYRQPFGRRSSRVQELAYVVKPRYEATVLRVVDRRKPESPLIGYEVLSKGDDDAPPTSVGRTDWRGELIVNRDRENPIQTLFVRSGQQLLGKLPMVGGQQRELVAPLRNDDLRLEAEGFLIGVQDSLVDLVARREVLANRIRMAVADEKIELAEDLLGELRGLDTQEDFALRVQQRKLSLTATDGSVETRIDDLFSQTRSLLGKYLNPEQVEILAQSIRDAKSSADNSVN